MMRKTRDREKRKLTGFWDTVNFFTGKRDQTSFWWATTVGENVWFFVQLACLAAVIYFTNGFYTKYHRFEVRTEIQCTGDIVFPTATMCDDFSSIILSKIAIRTKHWKREERAQNMISLTTKCIQDTKTSHPLLHHIP